MWVVATILDSAEEALLLGGKYRKKYKDFQGEGQSLPCDHEIRNIGILLFSWALSFPPFLFGFRMVKQQIKAKGDRWESSGNFEW